MGQIFFTDNDNDHSLRVSYEEDGDNGLIMYNKYIPEELIVEILCYVDHKSLLNCHLVCKRWKNFLQEYVWRKKANIIIGPSIQSSKVMMDSWKNCYNLCKKKPIGRNLLKNHSGQDGVAHWVIHQQGGDHWKIECPPVGVPPLPDNSVFEGCNCCFVTSYSTCSKHQVINLEEEGLSSYLLDTLQPSILVGEWYSGRWDCSSVYECSVSLVGDDNRILDTYQFRENIDGDDKQNLWHHFEHEFEDYGPGLRSIAFQHSGRDSLFWAGHYGSKMAGGSVIVKFKPSKRDDNLRKEEASDVDISPSRLNIQARDSNES